MKQQSNEVVATLEGLFVKFPPLPKAWKEFLVVLAPWFALIFGVLGLLVTVSALGFFTFLSPFVLMGGGVATAGASTISLFLSLVSTVLLLIAFPGLQARRMSGWNLFFWSEAVSVIASLATLNLAGALVGGLVGFYLLFQVKSLYK